MHITTKHTHTILYTHTHTHTLYSTGGCIIRNSKHVMGAATISTIFSHLVYIRMPSFHNLPMACPPLYKLYLILSTTTFKQKVQDIHLLTTHKRLFLLYLEKKNWAASYM